MFVYEGIIGLLFLTEASFGATGDCYTVACSVQEFGAITSHSGCGGIRERIRFGVDVGCQQSLRRNVC